MRELRKKTAYVIPSGSASTPILPAYVPMGSLEYPWLQKPNHEVPAYGF